MIVIGSCSQENLCSTVAFTPRRSQTLQSCDRCQAMLETLVHTSEQVFDVEFSPAFVIPVLQPLSSNTLFSEGLYARLCVRACAIAHNTLLSVREVKGLSDLEQIIVKVKVAVNLAWKIPPQLFSEYYS